MLLSFFTSKLGIGVIILLLFSGMGWYVKHLIGENAVLEATIGAEREAMVGFAKEVATDIEGYNVAMGALMQGYRSADDEQNRLEKLLAKHDLESLAKSKPGIVTKRINDGTIKLFKSIEVASGNTGDTGTASTTEAQPDIP